MVMNCVNLRSMKPAKWLSSPRWMGRRSCKVRTHDCRAEERVGESREGMKRGEGKEGLSRSARLGVPSFPPAAALCVASHREVRGDDPTDARARWFENSSLDTVESSFPPLLLTFMLR